MYTQTNLEKGQGSLETQKDSEVNVDIQYDFRNQRKTRI